VQLTALYPEIILNTENNEQIEQITRQALRLTTAKEFLTSKDDFEVILLISQIQALRLISHLAKELRNIETNTKRKEWLAMITYQYEKLYLRVLSRLKVA
jgi:arginine/lysine/ornithine decarboxylase